MPTVTDNDLKELKDLIKAGFSRIDSEIGDIKSEITDLKINQARRSEQLSGQIQALDAKLTGQINSVDERLTGQINAMDERLTGKINLVDEKITGLGKRLDFQEFLNRVFLSGVGVVALTVFAKLLGLLPKV
jgi:hypothetical protein